MVRLKSRYILFEILYPNSRDPVDQNQQLDASLKRDILIRHHQASPSDITIKTIIQEIRRSLKLNFGDYGSGKAGSLLQVKYFSNMTSTGIIRCHREDCDLVTNALVLMNKISNTENIIFNPVKISGTIKKIEEYAIRRSKKLVIIMQQEEKSSIDDFRNISDDEEREDLCSQIY